MVLLAYAAREATYYEHVGEARQERGQVIQRLAVNNARQISLLSTNYYGTVPQLEKKDV